MPRNYPPSYEELYTKLSSYTGMSKDEIDVFIIKMIKLISKDLNMKGKAILPYLGKFELKRMPPRKRSIKDFTTGERETVMIPAQDKLKFKINKNFSKLFR